MTTRTLTVALAGNPNTGKSTLFNALTGLRQQVGNYPGVTVEMKKGTARQGEVDFQVVDLPGTYSLAPRSPDEMVSVDLLLGHIKSDGRPDVIVSIVDATNLERHLYLTTQMMDIGVPVILAVNLVDRAQVIGLQIDFAKLQERLEIPVVPVQANRDIGMDALKAAILAAADLGVAPTPVPFPKPFQREVQSLVDGLGGKVEPFLASRLLLDVGGHTERQLAQEFGPTLSGRVQEARKRLAAASCPVPAIEAKTRFGWIRQTIGDSIRRPGTQGDSQR